MITAIQAVPQERTQEKIYSSMFKGLSQNQIENLMKIRRENYENKFENYLLDQPVLNLGILSLISLSLSLYIYSTIYILTRFVYTHTVCTVCSSNIGLFIIIVTRVTRRTMDSLYMLT